MQQARTPLIALPFSHAGIDQCFTVPYIEHLKAEEPASRDLRPYQDKILKKHLKAGSKRRGDLSSAPPATTWADLVRRAAEPVKVLPLVPLGPDALRAALVLRETELHRAGRAIVRRWLDNLEAIQWKKWGNPFTLEITPENCVELVRTCPSFPPNEPYPQPPTVTPHPRLLCAFGMLVFVLHWSLPHCWQCRRQGSSRILQKHQKGRELDSNAAVLRDPAVLRRGVLPRGF
jgi:hypothetical protein